jgi:hypothetical protein
MFSALSKRQGELQREPAIEYCLAVPMVSFCRNLLQHAPKTLFMVIVMFSPLAHYAVMQSAAA